MKKHQYCVIMCGGVGSRFWPFSRTDMPKQFLDFFGTGQSLLQLTVERMLHLVPIENIVLVTNEAYHDLVREQLPGVLEQNILLEPMRRNTAPCVCWAAHHIQALDPEALMMVLPSDHLILKETAFLDAMREGLNFIQGYKGLLTLGINPTSPETGYGYIQRGISVMDESGADFSKVKSFTEKPDLQLAETFVKSGEFFWNSGIFLWKVSSILEAFEIHSPDIAQLFDRGNEYYGTPSEQKFIDENFGSSQSISIDYAIMEKADNVFVKTVDLGWSDLGTWGALHEISPKDHNGNVTQNCKLLANDCKNSVFAIKGDKIVVATGLENYIVAENGNALLICPLDCEQRIRQYVNEVRNLFGEDYI